MYHNKLTIRTLAALLVLLGSLAAFAHEGMEHVMGTVALMTETSVTVDTVKHTKVTVLVDPSTKFIDNNVPASLKDLKVGDRVVIHAKRNPNKKLIGAEVKWGAGSMPTSPMEGMDHKY